MTIELKYLAWVGVLTALIWVPYIVNSVAVRGLNDALGYMPHLKPLAPWARRMRAAHYNAVENLVVFATLVLVAHLAGTSSEVTAFAAMAYFWARVVHLIGYTFAFPWVRTISFLAGFLCQMAIAGQILLGATAR